MRKTENHDIEIAMKSVTGGAPVTTVKIDGVDLSMKCKEITFRHKGGKIPTVTIDLIPDKVNSQVVGSVAKKRLL